MQQGLKYIQLIQIQILELLVIESVVFELLLAFKLSQEKSYQERSEVGIEAVALKQMYLPICLVSELVTQSIASKSSFTKNCLP